MKPAGGLIGRIVLLLLLAAAGFWLTTLKKAPVAPVESLEVGPHPPLDRLDRLVLSGQRDSVVIVAEGAAYWLIHPVRDRASDEVIAEIWRQMNVLKATRLLPDVRGAAFGLEPPRFRLRARDRGGRTFALDVGDSAAVASATYARVDGRIALLDGFTARRYFRPNLDYLRDVYPTSLGAGPVDSIEVRIDGRSLRAVRRSAEHWITRAPREIDLDALVVNRAVQFLRQPSIREYRDGVIDRHAVGLDPPRALWILHQAGRADTVAIGNPTADQSAVHIVPAHRPVIALMGSDFFRDFVDGWPRLADLRLLSIPTDSVTSITFLERGDALARKDGIWQWERGGIVIADTASFGRDLRNLGVLRWRSYPITPLASPAGERLTLRIASPTRAETLLIAAGNDTIDYARSSRHPRWGVVGVLSGRTWRYRATHLKP